MQLPFGLTSACYSFTKLTRPLIKYWRSQGLNLFIYIDDGLAVFDTCEHALNASMQVQLDIQRAGFVVNEKKSNWEPVRRIQWLGFIVDSNDNEYYVPQEMLTLFNSVIDMLLIVERRLMARDLAKFVGRAVSMERALWCIVRLMNRSAARLCAAAPHWEARVQLDELVVREMRFLRERARYFNGQSIIWGTLSGALQCYSDAGDTGYGAYVIAPSVLSARGLWSLVDSQRSSKWRELAAVHCGLVALRCQLVGLYRC